MNISNTLQITLHGKHEKLNTGKLATTLSHEHVELQSTLSAQLVSVHSLSSTSSLSVLILMILATNTWSLPLWGIV